MNGTVNGIMDETVEASSPNGLDEAVESPTKKLTEDHEDPIECKKLEADVADPSDNKQLEDEKSSTPVPEDIPHVNGDKVNDAEVEQTEEKDVDELTKKIETTDESDSEEDSSDDISDVYNVKEGDTVSINSDSDIEEVAGRRIKRSDSDIIIIEGDTPQKQNGSNNRNTESPEVHEIDSNDDNDDDCMVTNDEICPIFSKSKTTIRHRSSQAVKRKKLYEESIENGDDDDDDGSDIELVPDEDQDPLNQDKPNKNSQPSPKKHKLTSTQNNKNNSPSLVIIDTNSIIGKKDAATQQNKKGNSSSSAMNAQSLYQSIAARGTTLSAVSVSSRAAAAATAAAPPEPPPPAEPILPSLTDDMFVVEAPSFIVPYVYEKPSMNPFREFVDKLGKQLEEEKAKEEEERLQQKKLDKEKREQERKEKRERGEEVPESEEEGGAGKQGDDADDKKKKKKAEKKERRRMKDDDDASWDGSSSSDSDEEAASDDADGTVVIRDKVDAAADVMSLLERSKLPAAAPAAAAAAGAGAARPESYFECTLGKFFMDIGVGLVQEHVQADLQRLQRRKLSRDRRAGRGTRPAAEALAFLTDTLQRSKENNAPYALPRRKCALCTFRTESELVLQQHLDTPHMARSAAHLYRCNFCSFEVRSAVDIVAHTERVHGRRARLERAPSAHQCTNCPFEDGGKGKMARHQLACAKRFRPNTNLAPPTDWEPPAKIPKMGTRNPVIPGYNVVGRAPVDNRLLRATPATAPLIRPRVRPPAAAAAAPLKPGASIMSTLAAQNNPLSRQSGGKQPSLSITPLPRAGVPPAAGAGAAAAAGGAGSAHPKGSHFVICEICDGYIKDLEQLRNHMQWIHKVKIHPKMIYNRPPLNCQKCSFRFFTDQGLERHLLGSHGLVTSSMQEAANKGKDAGRCPVCGRVYQWKLLSHVSKEHGITLKPAHLSYKCTVCTATFGMYKQFESHVYSAHRVVAKRLGDKCAAPPAPPAAAAAAAGAGASKGK